MAEVIRGTMRDHRVLWEMALDDDDPSVARCQSCGYLSTELDTWEHQSNVAAEMLTAAGFGPVKAAQAGALRDAASELEEDASRSSYTDAEEVTQGQLDPAEWLRTRAAAVEGDA
jgi:hypothetical protein